MVADARQQLDDIRQLDQIVVGTGAEGRALDLGVIASGQPLYLCEGWATGATLHAETGHPVACAMNAGNLLEAGRHLQRRHPEAVLDREQPRQDRCNRCRRRPGLWPDPAALAG